MRRLLTLIGLAVTLALAGAAHAEPSFVFRGHGWGHGVGMAQWGAYGFAQHGWTYDRILAHYYQGTTLGQTPVKRLRVLLASGLGSVAISSDAPFTVRDSAGKTRVPAGGITLGPDLTLAVGGDVRQLSSPVRVLPGREPLRYDHAYRGALVVRSADGALSVVNRVKLEHYVYAIVPHEMPASWDAEALKVQAVAARTFAIASRKPGSYYDFRSNPIAQAYEGVEEEDRRTSAAVDATAGQIVLYEGEPALTFYSSSSGGRTAAVGDAFAGGQEIPYLQSVEDPYDDISPHHDWGPVAFAAGELASRLDLPGAPAQLEVETAPSGRVRTLVARGKGWRKEVPGRTVRTSLDLRSTWFTVARRGS